MIAAETVNQFEAGPDAVILVDADGRVLFLNGEAQRLTQYSPDDLLGQRVDSILVPNRWRPAQPSLRTGAGDAGARESRPARERLVLCARRKDGAEFPAEIDPILLWTEGGTLIAIVVGDITARREIESVLELAAQELASMRRALADDLSVLLRGRGGR